MWSPWRTTPSPLRAARSASLSPTASVSSALTEAGYGFCSSAEGSDVIESLHRQLCERKRESAAASEIGMYFAELTREQAQTIKQLTGEVERLTTEIEEVEEKSADMAQAQALNQALICEIEELEAAADASQTRMELVLQQKAEQGTELQRLKDRIAVMARARACASGREEELESRIATMASQRDAALRERKEIEGRAEAMQSAVGQLDSARSRVSLLESLLSGRGAAVVRMGESVSLSTQTDPEVEAESGSGPPSPLPSVLRLARALSCSAFLDARSALVDASVWRSSTANMLWRCSVRR